MYSCQRLNSQRPFLDCEWFFTRLQARWRDSEPSALSLVDVDASPSLVGRTERQRVPAIPSAMDMPELAPVDFCQTTITKRLEVDATAEHVAFVVDQFAASHRTA